MARKKKNVELAPDGTEVEAIELTEEDQMILDAVICAMCNDAKEISDRVEYDINDDGVIDASDVEVKPCPACQV